METEVYPKLYKYFFPTKCDGQWGTERTFKDRKNWKNLRNTTLYLESQDSPTKYKASFGSHVGECIVAVMSSSSD